MDPFATKTDAEFETALNTWLNACQALIERHWDAMKYTFAKPPVLKLDRGKRYIRVWEITRDQQGNETPQNGKSAFAFIDLTGGMVQKAPTFRGDVLKPDGWKAPAKHSRGNIFNKDGGMLFMSHNGPSSFK